MLRACLSVLGGRRGIAAGFSKDFERLVRQRSLVASPVQQRVVGKLEDLLSRLQDGDEPQTKARLWATERREKQLAETLAPTFLSYLKPSPLSAFVEEMPVAGPPPVNPYPTNGLYIFGPVGQGKTMILDAFHDHIRQSFPDEATVRCHFVHWMMAIHEALHQHQIGTAQTLAPIQELISRMKVLAESNVMPPRPALLNGNGDEDIVEKVALQIVNDGVRFVLLDEMQITNISDAMIFKRLAEILFELGVIFIFTSNCPPERLYEGGLNRSRFVPFIETIRSTCQPILLDSHRDYRGLIQKKKTLTSPPYSTPPRSLSQLTTDLLGADEYFSPSETKRDVAVDVFHGRQVPLVLLDESNGCGLVDFKSVCQTPTAPADFVGLARSVNRHLFIANVPQLNVTQDAEACRRFISLTDVFYENGVKMYYEAEVPPMHLIKGVSDVVETYDLLLSRAVEAYSSFDAMFTALFEDSPVVSQEDWRVAMKRLGITDPCSDLLWTSIPKSAKIDKWIFRSALCHHVIFAMSDNDTFRGVYPEGSMTAKVLTWLEGEATKESWKHCVGEAGRLGGYSLSPSQTTSEVGFAVPRLISRICEMAKPSE